MTFFYLTYMIVLFAISLDFITINYNIMGSFSILLYISGALAVVIRIQKFSGILNYKLILLLNNRGGLFLV